jgi:hypothetical protein
MKASADLEPDYREFFKLVLYMVGVCVLLLFFSSCGCSWHLKQVKKKCNYNVTTDTIYYRDTIVVDRVRLDTVAFAPLHDTVYLTKDRLKIKYVNLPGDSVFIQGICETDTIYKDRIKYINKTEYKASRPWWHWFLGGMLVAFFIETILIAILKR